jgi:uncharacterized membrane protein YebE (DUF533 family)
VSFSFWVRVASAPSFAAVVEGAGAGGACELAHAGAPVDGWPKGRLTKVPDASSAASALDVTPQLDALFAKLGLVSGAFIAHVPGKSSRGVEVSWLKKGTAQFRVCALATAADYALARDLAASLARSTGGVVEPEHGVDGGEQAPLTPDALVAAFDTAFFEKNAREMGGALLSMIVGGAAPFFFYGPRGWVSLAANDLAGAVDVDARLTRARAILSGAEAPRASAAASVVDGKRVAALLARAMVYAAAADGRLDPEEARVIERHFLTVNALRGYDADAILADAQRDGAAGASLESLRELPQLFRYTAFVLSAEILACTRGGKIYGELSDPNVQAASKLATILGLAADEAFIIRAGVTVAAKYIDGGSDVSDDMARTMTLAMLLAAAADGDVSDHETAVMAALAMTVPELRARDFGALVEAAKGRVAHAAADFTAMPKYKNKTYGLACEIALCGQSGGGGRISVPPVLDQLQKWLGVPADFADGAVRVYGAKYALST